jgi:putative mycofactocin binding protein MftB
MTVTALPAFDTSRPWGLHPQVALRPEPFGALAYHYGNRRLTFLRDPVLVDVVRALASYDSVDEAFDGCGVPGLRRPAFTAALAGLARSEIIRAR